MGKLVEVAICDRSRAFLKTLEACAVTLGPGLGTVCIGDPVELGDG
jgi:hypothetical protein